MQEVAQIFQQLANTLGCAVYYKTTLENHKTTKKETIKPQSEIPEMLKNRKIEVVLDFLVP